MELKYHDDNLTPEQIADKKEKLLDVLRGLTDDATERFMGNGKVDYLYSIATFDWKNYGKDRTYIKFYEERKGSKHSKLFECGYFDNENGDYVPKSSRGYYVFDILKDKI